MKFIAAVRKSSMLALCIAFIAPLLLTGCGGGVGGGGSISGTTLTSIVITPATVTVAHGQSKRLTATGTYYNGTTADISSQVTWTSTDTGVATINSNTGTVTGVAVGIATIKASASGITSPGASLTVSPAVLTGINITPTTKSTLKDTPVTFTATGTFSDGSSGDVTGSVTWASSKITVATMDASGVASALAHGNTTINASANGVTSNSAILTVNELASISINPATASVAKGLTTHFTATGTYTDASTADISSQVTWATGSSGIATINSSTGVATGVALGNTTVTASTSGITSSTATLTVSDAILNGISIASTTPSTPKGTPVTFTATGSYSDGISRDISGAVIWASTNTSVATISSSGIASSLAQGSTTVTASAGGYSSSPATLTVTAPVLTAISINPPSATVPKWLTTNFTATGTYTDGTTANLTTQVAWVAGDSSIATINSTTGVATGLTPGSTTTITASKSGIFSPGANLTVTAEVLTGISITPKITSTPKGTPVTFTAIGTYSDTSTGNVSGSVSWVSSKTDVAMIDPSGFASSLKEGVTTVTASVSAPGFGIVTDSAKLTVTAHALTAVSINPTTASVAKGLTTNFTATGTYTDGTAADITSQASWTSADTGVATINSSTGVATGFALGSANVTATLDNITSSAATLSVTEALLSSISITPAIPSTPKGTAVTFTATGNYSDGSTANLSGSAIWASTDNAVATINGSGTASSLKEGSTTVTASTGGRTSNSAALTVTAPVLATLSITPASARVTLGGTQQFTASGTLTDGTAATLGTLTWSSSDTAVASINSAGLATTVSSGSTNISATSGAITSNFAGLVVPLAAPSGLIAVAAPGQVTLSWSAVQGATSYNIYWGNTSGITGTTTQFVNVTSPYVHAVLNDGNTYYYHVSAVNATSETLSTETFAYLYPAIGGSPAGSPVGNFAPAGSGLKLARMGHISALLSSGKVLVTAGTDVNETVYIANSEIYDPVANTFSDTGSLLTARGYASSTTLPNGKVLVIGGRAWVTVDGTHAQPSLASVELYNPVTGTFSATGSMGTARSEHTATLLANGKVLVTGGCFDEGCTTAGHLNSAEIYDPVTESFTATGSMATARTYHTATLLPNGKVLVAGGCNTQYCTGGELNSAEIYDPATGLFTATGNMTNTRHKHTATLLPSGEVIIIGGEGVNNLKTETYNMTGTFHPTADLNVTEGAYRSAILLSNGIVIVMPCGCGSNPTGAHLYNPATDSFSDSGHSNGFKHQNAVLTPNGRILLTGGQTAGIAADPLALPPVVGVPAVITNDAEYFY